MRMYDFAVTTLNAEKMWDFSMSNSVNFHYVKTLTKGAEKIYVYEGLMTEETLVMFKLAVPTISPT